MGNIHKNPASPGILQGLRRLLAAIASGLVLLTAIYMVYIHLNDRDGKRLLTFHDQAIRICNEINAAYHKSHVVRGSKKDISGLVTDEILFVNSVTVEYETILHHMERLRGLHDDFSDEKLSRMNQRIESAIKELRDFRQRFKGNDVGFSYAFAVSNLYTPIVTEQALRIHLDDAKKLGQRMANRSRVFLFWFVSLITLTAGGLFWYGRHVFETMRGILKKEKDVIGESVLRGAQLNEAQQLAKVGSWELDLVSRNLHWSDEIFRIFEIDKSRFAASYEAFLNAIHPDDRDLVNGAYTESVANNATYIIQHRLQMDDGRIKWVEERGQTFYDADGKPLRSVGTVQDITTLHEAEQALQALNADLEVRVQERTVDLIRVNAKLQRSLDDLQRAQVHLVQSEKMAALGGLVAGVAHEINTPVGVGVTAASHLQMMVRDAGERYRTGQLTRGEMEEFLKNADTATQMVLSNLGRAADLVRSFKQVAVDQSSNTRRQFRLKGYLEEVLTSLGPTLKRTRHAVNIECADELSLYSHPGAYSQIITNLVMNSVIHGFEGIEAGHITIAVSEQPEGLLLRYSDDGKGIAPEHLKKIFDPFFTTRRGQGGSGLGLHVVYNLVTQTLGGAITCESAPGQGVRFEIKTPIKQMELEVSAASRTL